MIHKALHIVFELSIRRFICVLQVLFFVLPIRTNAQDLIDFEKTDDAVVAVVTFDYFGNIIGHGSGFFVDPSGLIITNYHVVQNAYKIKILTDIAGIKEYHEIQEIVSGNKKKDIVKIAILNLQKRKFPFLQTSSELPKKGQDCWAIGTPSSLDYMNTVSRGIVSNIDLNINPIILQTNAEITHGSSGGALLNSTGKVIGITSAGDDSEDGARASINFAVWSGEINNLEKLALNNLLPSDSIPSVVSFYTQNSEFTNLILFIDEEEGIPFEKSHNYKPNCMSDGVVTKIQMKPGNHYYTVLNMLTSQTTFGNFNLNSRECKVICVDEQLNSLQSPIYNAKPKSNEEINNPRESTNNEDVYFLDDKGALVRKPIIRKDRVVRGMKL